MKKGCLWYCGGYPLRGLISNVAGKEDGGGSSFPRRLFSLRPFDLLVSRPSRVWNAVIGKPSCAVALAGFPIWVQLSSRSLLGWDFVLLFYYDFFFRFQIGVRWSSQGLLIWMFIFLSVLLGVQTIIVDSTSQNWCEVELANFFFKFRFMPYLTCDLKVRLTPRFSFVNPSSVYSCP